MIQFRKYDPSRPRKPSTPAQDAARDRNWRIVRLRGLWFAMSLLTGARRDLAQKLVDDELWKMGAETQTARRARERKELETRAEKDRECPIPF